MKICAFHRKSFATPGHLLKNSHKIPSKAFYWMKTLLSPLPLWLAIASLVSPLTAQSVSELELEKSSTLNVWESVTITPEMISGSGKLLVPTSGSQQFYRMKVRLLESPTISNPPPATTGIEEGESVTFTVDSQGEGLTYQWYMGQSGDTSQAIQDATSQTYNTGALTEDTSYWVKVTNVAGSINSETVAVTINRPPTITSPAVHRAGQHRHAYGQRHGFRAFHLPVVSGQPRRDHRPRRNQFTHLHHPGTRGDHEVLG